MYVRPVPKDLDESPAAEEETVRIYTSRCTVTFIFPPPPPPNKFSVQRRHARSVVFLFLGASSETTSMSVEVMKNGVFLI